MTIVDFKSAAKSQMVYATDSSKATVLVLFLFCVDLWSLYYAFHDDSYFCPCSHVLKTCLALQSIHLGKRKLEYILLLHLFDHLACVTFCQGVA